MRLIKIIEENIYMIEEKSQLIELKYNTIDLNTLGTIIDENRSLCLDNKDDREKLLSIIVNASK